MSDVSLRGLFNTSTSSSLPNPVFDTKGARSEMALLLRYRSLRWTIFASGDTSDIVFPCKDICHILVKFASGDISEMRLSGNHNVVRLVKPDRGERSEIRLLPSVNVIRLVSSASGDRSDIALLLTNLLPTNSQPRRNSVRLVANSSPVRSLIPLLDASSHFKVDISPHVIVASRALPKLSAMTARKLASGMLTGVGSSLIIIELKRISTPLL